MHFYNPGTKFSEKLLFTHSNTDAPEGYVSSYWDLTAKEEDFFEIPDFFDMPGVGGGEVQVSLKTVIEKARKQYRERAVIIIDPRYEGDDDDADNIAKDKASAKRKGVILWAAFMRAKAMEHIANVEQCKARGVPPPPATHLFRHALQFMGIDDPANQVDVVKRVREEAQTQSAQSAEIKELRDMIHMLKGQLEHKNTGKAA